MNDWVKPPVSKAQWNVWTNLFPFSDLFATYYEATHSAYPNTISVQRMEKFTQACVVARLKGELK